MATIKHEIDNSAAVQAEQRYRREKEKSNKALEDEVKAAKIADRETQRFLKQAQTEQQKWAAAQAKAQELKRREPRLVKEIEASLERQRRAIFGVDRAEKMRAQAAEESAKRELAERRKLIAAANEQKAAQEKLLAQGRRITQDLETPTERYKRKVLELGRAYRSGSISKETFIRGTRKLKAELATATTQAQAAGAATRGAFGGSAATALQGYLGAALSVGGAISTIRTELQKAREEGERINQAQQAAFRSDRAFNRAVGGLQDEGEKQFLRDSAERIIDSGFDRTRVQALLAETISSQPDPKQAVALVDKFILETVDLSIEDAAKFLGGTGDIANSLQTRDLDRARGVIASIQTSARLSGPTATQNVARNAPQVLTNFAVEGADPVLGAAAFAGLSVGGTDDLGERARTAGVQLPEKLKQFFSASTRGFRREDIDELDEQLNAVLADQELARTFIDEAKFGVRAAAGAKALFLQPGSEARNAFNRVVAAIGTPELQKSLGIQASREVTSGTFEGVEATERALAVSAENLRLRNGGVISEQARKDLVSLTAKSLQLRNGGIGLPFQETEASLFLSAGSQVSPREATTFLEGALAETLTVIATRERQLENRRRLGLDTEGPANRIDRLEEIAGEIRDAVSLLKEAVIQSPTTISSGRQEN